MSEPEERYVCDLTLLMRTRLLCGLYNDRSVPPRWRRLAQAYCLIVAVAIFIFAYFTYSFWEFEIWLFMIPSFLLYYLCIFISLWTGDEYIYRFFTQNKLTDVTLDSTQIFSRLQEKTRQTYYRTIAFFLVNAGVHFAIIHKANLNVYLLVILSFVVNVLSTFSLSSKLLVMALFDARMLVLKRRLQRYGFRTIGRARPQPYCQIYDEILQGLSATDNPLKLLIFVDLVCNCTKLIAFGSRYVTTVKLQNLDGMALLWVCVISAVSLVDRLLSPFGHVVFLESANVHCEEMTIFTATQLIKTPTAEERLRIRQFLGALERRGARYRVLRALPIDARFVLRVLGFCSAQIIVMITAITANSEAKK